MVPTQLRLLYLADGESLTYQPDEAELRRFERTLDAIWLAIRTAGRTGDFRPNPSRMCDWCSHRALCPAWDGTPPAVPGLAAGSGGGQRERDPGRPGRVTGRSTGRDQGSGTGQDCRMSDEPPLEPYYLPLDGPDGERFHATFSTTGPWFADAQHAGPPSALIIRALERCDARPGTLLSRITVEVLGPVPAGEVAGARGGRAAGPVGRAAGRRAGRRRPRRAARQGMAGRRR